jgi:hypothetical protein
MQLCSLVFFASVYVAAVYAQLTVGERSIRQLGVVGLLVRAALSVAHAALGYVVSLALGVQLSAMIYGNYQRGIFGPYTFRAMVGFALVSLAIPWLPLVWRRLKSVK